MALAASLGSSASAAERIPTVLLADPHRIVRQAVRILLECEGEFAVVGEAGGAAEAAALVDRLQPDAVITELHLGEGSALEFIAETHARFPQIAILVLTAFRARDRVASARRAGARGYLMKNRGRRELVSALRTARAGRWYRPDQVVARAARTPTPEDANYASTRVAYLTSRQQQVLQALALGHPTRDIAQMLGVSVQAVHRLRERLLQALQLRGTAALTRFAVREGLVGAHAATPEVSQPDSLDAASMLPGALATR